MSGLHCLVDHCRTVHEWRERSCPFKNCQFVAYNSLSFSSHKTVFHSKHKQSLQSGFPCLWKGCSSTFGDSHLRDIHMRIHSNQLLCCSFCPFRTNKEEGMRDHYRAHYQMRNHKCETCERAYVKRSSLMQHYEEKHAKERVLTCMICRKYTGSRRNVQKHIRNRHNMLSRWNDKTKELELFER